MKILVACEFSGTVRDAFRARGHDAMSCDLLPTAKPGLHYEGDVMAILNDGFDLMIAHPPCTHLAVSGARHFAGKVEEQREALAFTWELLHANIPKIALENPVGIVSTRIRKPEQIIQPYQFGHDASKKTCLWLKGLPLLQPTALIAPRIVDGLPRWSNQTDSGQNRLGPSEERWKLRSATYQGIADAMALQWGQNPGKAPEPMYAVFVQHPSETPLVEPWQFRSACSRIEDAAMSLAEFSMFTKDQPNARGYIFNATTREFDGDFESGLDPVTLQRFIFCADCRKRTAQSGPLSILCPDCLVKRQQIRNEILASPNT